MQKILLIASFLISFSLLLSCNNNSDSSKKNIQVVEKQSVKSILDSNYVLENIASLKDIQSIESKFGKENIVKDSFIAGPEGTTINVSVLFPKTPNEVIIYWKEKEKFTKLDAVVIRCDSAGYLGKWHSKLGLQAGQNLEKVIELNQKPFTISGFGWDYGGHIVSWEGGKLDNKRVTGRFADFGNNKISDTEYQSISGDTEFMVGLPAIKKLNPVLEELTVFGR